MSLEHYQSEWVTDSALALDALDEAARNVPYLHAKWWKHYSTERLRFKKLDSDYRALYRQRWEYWMGKLDDTERTLLGWPVQPLKILSGNVNTYLDADPVLAAAKLRLALAEETCRFLEDVIKHINNRGFTIKNAIDFLKFKMGV
jgi:hypothetical protein